MNCPSGKNQNDAAPALPARKKKKRWPRIRFWLLVMVGAAVAGRVLLWLMMPWIVALAAGALDLRCDYERLHLSLLGGSLELWNASIHPEGSDEPFVELEYLTVDVATTALFTGRLVVRRVEVDGLDVSLHRRPDGTFPFDSLLARFRSTAGEKQVVPEVRPPAPIDFSLPAQVDAVRLQHVQIQWKDETQSPPILARVDVHVRASNLGHPEREARFEVMVGCPGTLDGFWVEGRGRGVGQTLEARVEVRLRGLKPAGLAPYLVPLGIQPLAEDVDFGLKAEVSVTPAASNKDVAAGKTGDVSARLRLHEVVARADHQPFFRLDEATVHTAAVRADRVLVDRVVVKGWQGQATRNAAGRLVVAGFEILEPERAARPVGTQATANFLDLARMRVPEDWKRLGVREIVLEAGEVKLHDQTVQPATDLALRLVRLTASDVLVDPALHGEVARLEAEFVSPGVFDRLTLTAEAALHGPAKTIRLDGRMTGITLLSLDSFLTPLHLEPVVRQGDFRWTVDARLAVGEGDRLTGSLSMHDVRFQDGDGTALFSLDRVQLEGLVQEPASGVLRLGSVEVAGSRLNVVREPDGAFCALGLRFRPATKTEPTVASSPVSQTRSASSSPAQPSSTPVPSGSTLPPLPGAADLGRLERLEVGRVVVKDHGLRFHDQVPEPAVDLTIRDMGLTLDALALELNASPDAANAPAAQLTAWIEAPGLAERLSAKGALTLRTTGGDLAVDFAGQGITAALAAPYLRAVGLSPELRQGSLRGRLAASVTMADHAIDATAALTDVHYADEAMDLVSLGALRVTGLRQSGRVLAVESIQVEAPHVQLWRRSDHSLALGGMRQVTPVPLRPPTPQKRVESRGTSRPGSAVVAAASPEVQGATPDQPSSPPAGMKLVRFQLSGAEAVFHDETRAKAGPITAMLEAEVANVVVGPKPAPASFRVAAAVPGALDRVELEGRVSFRPGHESLDMTCTAEGIRPDALGAVRVAKSDPPRPADPGARFQASLSASLVPHAEGGRTLAVDLRDVAIHEAGREVPGFQLDSFAIRAPRLDPENGVIDVASITLAGTRGRVERQADGRWCVCGLTWPEAAPKAVPTAAATPVPPAIQADEAAPGSPVVPSSTKAAPPAVLRPLDRLAWRIRRRQTLPRIQLGTLDLELASLQVVDRTQAGSVPLEVEGMHLRNQNPIVLLGEDPEVKPPIELTLTGKVAPLVDAFELQVTASPFASEPQLRWSFQARGIHGEGLTRVQPSLAARMDGRPLTDGRFTATGSVVLRGRRRHALDFAFDRGWSVETHVNNVVFRNGDKGPVLLGVDEILVDAPRIDPASGNVHVRTVEILKPTGRVRRDEAGLHVAGVVWKNPKPEAASNAATDKALLGAATEKAAADSATDRAVPEAAAPTVAAVPPARPAPGPVTPARPDPAAKATDPATLNVPATTPATTPVVATPPASSPGVVRLDSFHVSGLDFTLEDTTVTPPLLVPLDDLEVEVKGLTSRMLTEEIPALFTVWVGAGKVKLRPPDRASFLGGALRDTVKVVSGQGLKTGPLEERPLFQEVLSSGEFFLAPRPHGRVTTAASMVELAAFQGAAARAGVTLTAGLFDGTVELNLQENGNLVTEADFTFTDLSLSEPPGGPIMHVLQLPAPLNTVLFVLRDQAGAIHVPLSFTVDAADGVSAGEITGQVAKVLGRLIVEAIAASPFRVVGAVTELTDMAGLGGLTNLTGLTGGAAKGAGQPVELTYTAAATTLRHVDREALDRVAADLKERRELVVTLSAEIGQEDLACARVRANPSRDDCLALVARLRQRTNEILDRRGPIAERARAARATGLDQEATRAVDELRALDRELGLIERSLDQLGDLLRPGAERYAERRTRAVAMAMAVARLKNVENHLRARGPDLKDRVQLSRPRYDPGTDLRHGRVVVKPSLRRTK